MDGITKEAVGALSEAKPWETREGEKFLQGTKHKAMKGEGNGDGGYRKGVRCRHGSANCASGGATCTLERRALEVFGDSHGTAYLLGPTTSDLKEFSYSRATGLVLASILSPPQRMERPQIVVISSPLTLTSRQQETAAARKVFPTKPEPELPTTPEALARTPDVAPSLGSCERHAAVAAVTVSQTEQHRHAAMSTRHLCSAPQPSAATPRRVFHPSPAAKFR